MHSATHSSWSVSVPPLPCPSKERPRTGAARSAETIATTSRASGSDDSWSTGLAGSPGSHVCTDQAEGYSGVGSPTPCGCGDGMTLTSASSARASDSARTTASDSGSSGNRAARSSPIRTIVLTVPVVCTRRTGTEASSGKR